MSEELAFAECDRLVRDFEKVVKKPIKKKSSIYYTGVDLGTACVVLAVLDENRRPVAGAYRYADVVKDGMVVDYIGAIRLVREMKEELEEKLGTELIYAAAAIPPGTDALDGGAIKNVVQGAGFEITALLDEPTAALDAISENEMYETYSTLLKNKTALFISHRLASTRFCDTILFLENGKIKERGTHDELLALGGSYAHMFEVQSQYYQETEEHI